MQVRAAGVAGGADPGDRLALLDPVTFVNEQLAGMGVQRRDSVSVIEHHRLAVFLLAPRDHHRPRRDRPDLLALEAVDVDPLVVMMAAAQTEAARDPAVNRPRDAHEARRRRPVTVGEGRDRGCPGFPRPGSPLRLGRRHRHDGRRRGGPTRGLGNNDDRARRNGGGVGDAIALHQGRQRYLIGPGEGVQGHAGDQMDLNLAAGGLDPGAGAPRDRGDPLAGVALVSGRPVPRIVQADRRLDLADSGGMLPFGDRRQFRRSHRARRDPAAAPCHRDGAGCHEQDRTRLRPSYVRHPSITPY